MPLRRLRRDHAEVWLASADAVEEPVLAACRLLLSSDERARSDRFHRASDRALYVIAHALARRALSRYAGVAPVAWRFVSGAHGRPSVAPGLPPIAFNLSHTRGLCACIVSGAPAVGVDVEEMRDLADPFEVAARSFAAAEVADLRTLATAGGAVAVRERFYALWTLKESYIKARGLGLALPLGAFAFALDGARLRLGVDPSLGDDARRWSFALFAASPRHRLATAVARDDGAPPGIDLFTDPLDREPSPLSLPLLARSS